MNFTYLEYIILVSNVGSISKAADILLLTQPYLSNIIKKVEKDVGYKIFKRKKSGVELTEEGVLFIKYSKNILFELDAIKNLKEDLKSSLSISSYYSPFIMSEFLKFKIDEENYDEVKIPIKNLPNGEKIFLEDENKNKDVIEEKGNYEVFKSVYRGKSSLGIIYFSDSKLEYFEQFAEEYKCDIIDIIDTFKPVIMIHKNHILGERKNIKIREISKYKTVVYSDLSSRNYLNILGLEDKGNYLNVSDRASLIDAVKYGGYMAISSAIDAESVENCTYIEISDINVKVNIAFVKRKNEKVRLREKKFIDYIKKKYK